MIDERHEIIEFSPNIPLKIFMHKLGYVARHWHTGLELLMVLEGQIRITVDGSSYTLSDEDVILINSNSIHEISSENAVIIALQIELSRITQFDVNLDTLLFDCNSAGNTHQERYQGLRFMIATMIRENAHHSAGAEYKNYSLCYYLVSELLEYFQIPCTEEIRDQKKYMVRLTRIISYIQEHYAENFTLTQLAEIENLSVPYLSNFFDKYMGINFSQYYINVKLEHAVADLLSTSSSIESIAIQNGFTESHSFVRSFKKKYQMLPSAYRKLKKGEDITTQQNNFNYLLIEPSSYLHLLTKYLSNNEKPFYHTTSPSSTELNLPAVSVLQPVPEVKLEHTFKKFVTVGRAKELLNTTIQEMLRDMQNTIGYEYIKFHGILSDDMMVVSRVGRNLQFNYYLVDMVLDFIRSIGLKPLIQLSFMPQELASDPEKTIFFTKVNTSPPREITEWNLLIEDFTTHLLERYGKKEVLTWLFSVWNEPVTPKSMFGFGDDQIFFQFYKNTYRSVKKICPDILFGSPSILYLENLGSGQWIRKFITYTRKHDCVPEFMNMHYYSDVIPKAVSQNFYIGTAPTFSFPKRTDDFSLWIGSIKKIMSSLELDALPIYMTEWNFTLSHRNLINDSCFKSCYILKNLLKNYDRLQSFGYWSLTDLIEENALPQSLFHGGLGIYTMNGIRKNVFYAFEFANRLGDELLASGDSYFITRSDRGIQIITYHYIHYGNLFASGELFDITETQRYSAFDMSRSLDLNVDLTDLENGQYEIREYFVNRSHGSAYDNWLRMGGLPLDPADSQILKASAVPGYHKEQRLIENGQLHYSALLEPLEIRIAEITPVLSRDGF